MAKDIISLDWSGFFISERYNDALVGSRFVGFFGSEISDVFDLLEISASGDSTAGNTLFNGIGIQSAEERGPARFTINDDEALSFSVKPLKNLESTSSIDIAGLDGGSIQFGPAYPTSFRKGELDAGESVGITLSLSGNVVFEGRRCFSTSPSFPWLKTPSSRRAVNSPFSFRTMFAMAVWLCSLGSSARDVSFR